MNSTISRRSFLRISTGSAIAAALSRFALPAFAANAKIPIALELYSVRKECAQDTAGTIAAVAKMGYKGVEFAGFYKQDAKTLRKILDDNGLKCCGSHTPLSAMLGDELKKTIEFNKTIGNKNLIVPSLPKDRTATRQSWLDTAKMFNELSDKVGAEGMRTGYHNHTIEFKALDGELPWDTFFGNTKKEVIMQFDTGNAMHGGGEAIQFLKKYPGRAVTVHCKPYSKTNPKALIGEDDLPWKAIFDVCESIGNTEWYIVEYENTPALESVEKCFLALKKMGKA